MSDVHGPASSAQSASSRSEGRATAFRDGADIVSVGGASWMKVPETTAVSPFTVVARTCSSHGPTGVPASDSVPVSVPWEPGVSDTLRPAADAVTEATDALAESTATTMFMLSPCTTLAVGCRMRMCTGVDSISTPNVTVSTPAVDASTATAPAVAGAVYSVAALPSSPVITIVGRSEPAEALQPIATRGTPLP